MQGVNFVIDIFMVVFELFVMITHVPEMITGHFDEQSMDDKDEKGMEKDKYS